MILAVARGEALRERLAANLRDTRWDTAVAEAESVGEAERVLTGATLPAAIIVGRSIGVVGASDIARAANALRQPPAVLLVAEPTTELLRTAMRAGIRDVLPPDFGRDDLARALDEAVVSADGPTALPGMTVSVFSTKGGVGTSVLAANLATRLAARTGMRATLVDLDLASADQAIMHGKSPRWTMQDLASGAVGLDAESLDQVLLEIEGSGARLLPGPVDPALAETISSGQVASVIGAVRSQVPLAVLDTASAFDDRTLAALDASDVVVVATSLDVAALRSLTVALQTLPRLGVDPARTLIALVRADSKSGLLAADVERAIDRSIDVGVPSARQVPRSVNEGVPLAVSSPKSPIVQAVDVLVELVLALAPAGFEAAPTEAPSRGRGGFFPWSRTSDHDDATSASTDAGQDDVADGGADTATQGHAVQDETGAADAEPPSDDSDEPATTVQLPDDVRRLDDVRRRVQETQVRRVRRPVERPPAEAAGGSTAAGDEALDDDPQEQLSSMPPPSVQQDDDDEPRRRRRR